MRNPERGCMCGNMSAQVESAIISIVELFADYLPVRSRIEIN